MTIAQATTTNYKVAGMKRSSITQLWASLIITALGIFAAIGQSTAGETVTYYHVDALGSPVAATDSSANVIWREEYDAYGDRIRDEGSTNNNLWYTGKFHEQDIGLTYFGARWYDPVVGRFMAIDPVEFQDGNIHSFNRYAYANNNPYKFVDPDGNSPLDVVFLVADAAKFAKAVVRGEGIAAAATDLAISAIGVASPIPGAGLAIKAGRAADKAADVAKSADNLGDYARNYQRSAGAAQRVPQVLQSGGNKFSNRTADGLNEYFETNLTKRDWGRALEGLKKDNGLRNDHHGRILDNGDYVNDAGDLIGNISHYLP